MTPQQTWSFHDASSRVGEGRGWSCLPPGAVRSCHRTGSRAVTGRGLGLPAVTSLTLAETIHLVWRGPPWVERGTCRSPEPACTGRQECSGHTSPAHSKEHGHKKACAPARVCSSRAVSSTHRHNLQRRPHESFPCRQIQETEVTRSRKAAQTQINKLAVTLVFTHTDSLSLTSSFLKKKKKLSLYTYASLGSA